MPYTQNNTFLLDGQTLTTDQLTMIIQNNSKIDLTTQAWNKVKKSRQIIKNMMSDGKKVVYGINTGFGNFADKIISIQDRQKLQLNLIRSHAVCVSTPLPLKIVKRMMILRINTLSKGRSGFNSQNLEKYINACNNNYFPMIPCKGTVGASGDLAPLSQLALGMLGQGLAWDQQSNKFIDAKIVMQKKKLQPVKLGQKQGLALINGTQFMSSIVSQVQTLARQVCQSALYVFAFSAQVFGFDSNILNEQVINFYKQSDPNFGKILYKFRNILNQKSSQLHQQRIKNASQKHCDAQSILGAIQCLSALIKTLDFTKKLINQQLNSATDNPLVYSKEDGFQTNMLITAGNFHGQYVAKSSDFISMALFNIGKYSQARIQRYVNQRISGLPGFLVKDGGLNSGYMIVQYTSAAILSESKVLVKPASADSISTSASQQDHVSMGGFAARKARQMVDNIAYIIGIQFMCAMQAVDLVNKQPSQKLSKIMKQARKQIKFVQQDYYFGPQIQIAQKFIINGLNKLL